MQFGLNESQQILQTNARKFFAAECPMQEVRRIAESSSDYDAALWRKMANQGYIGVILPEEYGGLGLGMIELALLMEEMGRALVPGPFMSTLVAAVFVEVGGSDEQKRTWLTGISDGSVRAAAGVIEPNAALDIYRTEVAGGATISGTKLFVSGADSADFILAVANNGVFLVPKGPGVTVEPTPNIDITRKLFAVKFDRAPCEVLPNYMGFMRAVEICTMAIAAETVAKAMVAAAQSAATGVNVYHYDEVESLSRTSAG